MLGYKLAAHAHDRIEERSTLSRALVDEAQKRLKDLPKDGAASYHWTARQGDQVLGHLAVKRVGKEQKLVVATFLGPQMKPSGVELTDQLGPLLPAQKAAEGGKAKVFAGLKVRIDRPKGFVQQGKDAQGKPWKRVYKVDYGYLPGTEGGDGEGLDVFFGPSEQAETAYLVRQNKDDGSFDEFKLMLGFGSKAEALACYDDHIPSKLRGKISEVPVVVLRMMSGQTPDLPKVASVEVIRCLLEEASRNGDLVQELGKYASTRYEREIQLGNILRSEVAPVAPVDTVAPFLAPAARKATREYLIAPADRPQDEVDLRRRLNLKRNEAFRTPQGHGLADVTVSSEVHPGVIAGAMPKLMGGTSVSVPSSGMSSVTEYMANKTPMDDLKTGLSAFQSARRGEGPGLSLFEHAQKRFPPTASDATQTYATLRHELGEAEEFSHLNAGRGVRPFASHLGSTPILREQEAMLGDPDAFSQMAKVRQLNQGDVRVQKLIRQVGGTADRPLPVGGRQQRALDRLIDAKPQELDPVGRGLAIRLGQERVPYLPKDVPSIPQLVDETSALKGKGMFDRLRGAKDLAGKALRLGKFINTGR